MEVKETRILMRGRKAAEWAALNEVLMSREMGIVTDSSPIMLKIGTGITPWNSLPFVLDAVAIQSALDSFSLGQGNAQLGIAPAANLGVMNVTDAGTYTVGYGGLVVTTADLAAGLVQFRKIGATWTKVLVPINLSAYATKTELSERVKKTDFASVLSEHNIISDFFGDAFYVSDVNGNVIFKVLNGVISYVGQVTRSEFNELKSNPLFSSISTLYPNEFIISDIEGNVMFRTNPTGTDFYGKGSGGSSSSVVKLGNYQSDYIQFLIFGQSLSVLGNFSAAIDFFNAKTFTGGILTNYDPDDATAKAAYYGSSLIALPTTGAETQGKGIARIVQELVKTENGIDYPNQGFTPIVNSAGTGGATWFQLQQSTGIYYRRLIESVKYANDMAIAQGKTYSVGAMAYIQGEAADEKLNTVQQFYDKLDSLFTKVNTDVKAITKQTTDVQFINYQIASYSKVSTGETGTGVPLAQYKISLDKANVHFGCAMYQFTYTDDLHVNSDAVRIMGANMGVALKRMLVDGTKMLPISPKAGWIINKNSDSTKWVINMKMNVPVRPLVFDESINSLFTTAPTNYGFSIKNGGGTEIITGVTTTHGDTINISCNQDPTGLELKYAIGGRDSGGNLRDSQGDTIKVSCNGTNKRVDNWCPIFKQII